MNLVSRVKVQMNNLFSLVSGSHQNRIGIYGPPNAGKSTLANRITNDFTGETFSGESAIPHETRRTHRKEDITIKSDSGASVTIDIVDTPGVDTKIDKDDFIDLGMDSNDAVRRSREATEGIASAMRWLKTDIDGVIYVLDSTKDPFTHTNTMILGIIESQDIPVLVFANKTDKEGSDVARIVNAFPNHETTQISALEGENMDQAYQNITRKFGR
jgi:small GTP-binding protein